MGMFSRNRTGLGAYNGAEIVAEEAYYGEMGALQITLEGLQNDQDIFNACLENEFNEAIGLMSGAITESEIVEEASGAVAGFIEKIKTMVKKIWAKIKGLFDTFIKKINSVIIRDNKKFVEKYKREVLTKDLSKMKYKWQKPKDFDNFAKVEDAEEAIDTVISDICKQGTGLKDLERYEEELSDGTAENRFYSGIIKGSDASSFAKDYHELWFEDEEEEEGLSSSDLSEIISILIDKKLVTNLEKNKKSIDKVFSNYLKTIDKQCNAMVKNIPGEVSNYDSTFKRGEKDVYTFDVKRDKEDSNGKDKKVRFGDGKDGKDLAMKKLNMIQKLVTKTQSLFAHVTSCEITETKFKIAQARRIFAKAVSYNPKKVNESAFVEAAGDAAYYDVMSLFEDYSM